MQNQNIENASQKLILLSGNMFDYIVRLLVWAVEGGDKVSKHSVQYRFHAIFSVVNLHIGSNQHDKYSKKYLQNQFTWYKLHIYKK